jgi:predicted permease
VVVVGAAVAIALIAEPWLNRPLFGLSGGASIREFDSVARLDLATIAWIVAAAALVALALAALDARQTLRSTSVVDLRLRGAALDRGARRRLSAAIVVQCALSFALAAAGILVTLGYRHLVTMDRGYDGAHVALADLAFPPARYPTPASRDRVTTQLLDALRAMPGVASVGASTVTPDYGGDWAARFVVPGRTALPPPGYELTNHRLVTPDYLDTMQIPLDAGRGFDRTNRARDAGAVVVSKSFATHVWPGESAVGKTLDRVDLQGHATAHLEVIGVAGDVVEAVRDPDAPAPRSWYLPTTAGTDYDYPAITFAVRTNGPTPTLAADINRALAGIDRDLAFAHVAPMRERLSETVSREETSSFLFGLFAACSLLIALGGLYGALAFVVEAGRRELGVRLALGASARRLLGNVLLRTLGLAGGGIAIGLLLALPALKLVGAYVYGVSLADAWALVPLAAVIVMLAALVGTIPARRAARTDPVIALNQE